MRRQIAQHLTRAQAIPAVTWVDECRVDALEDARGGGSLVPFLLRATALALASFPELNARLEGEEIVLLDRYDLGLAVQADRGLVVPVVRGCDRLAGRSSPPRWSASSRGARADTLTPEELRGSTFTVTSAGRSRASSRRRSINEPEVAILGLHRITERAVLDGEVVTRKSRTSPPSTTGSSTVRAQRSSGSALIELLEAPQSSLARRGEVAREVRREHALDPRRAGAAVDPVDDALVLDEHDGRDAPSP